MTIRTNSTLRPSLPTSFRSLVGCACAAVFSLLLVACNPAGSEEKMRVSVSIAPLRYAVESLLDTNVVINVLTSDGASPETYQLTPKQVAELSESQLYVRVGSLGFENTQMRKVTQNMPHLLCVNSARGISPLRHSHGDEMESEDPHVWMSPINMKVIAHNVLLTLESIDTVHEVTYAKRFHLFVQRMDSIDNAIRQKLRNIKSRAFLIYHPALGYYAKNYGLRQLSVQNDGKEPSADYLAHLIQECRREKVRVVFYGKGAGKLPTASAVVADVIDCVKHFKARKYLFWEDAKPNYVADFGSMETSAFVRVSAKDSDTALNTAADVFGKITPLLAKRPVQGEAGFTVENLTEKELCDKLAALEARGVKVEGRIRISDY